MLEELNNISHGRQVVPDRMPQWINLVKQIEGNIPEDQRKVYRCNGRLIPIIDGISQIEGLSVKDIELYTQLQPHLWQTSPSIWNKGICRGYIASCMLNMLYAKNQEEGEPFCINCYGAEFNRAFFDLEVHYDTVIDSLRGSDTLSEIILNGDKVLTVANSQGCPAIQEIRQNGKGSLIISNCEETVRLRKMSNGRLRHLILYGCVVERADYVVECCEYLTAVECIFNDRYRLDCTFDQSLIDGSVSYKTKKEAIALGRQMQGKSGLEVYALGKQIIKIIEERERDA